MLGVLVWAMLVGVSQAIILHPDHEPDPNWAERPDNEVVGAWSYNASFCVISPKWIITTRHQNTFPSTVTIGSGTYKCIYNPKWVGGPDGNSDIRLIKLKNQDGSEPNLAKYASIYESRDEINSDIVIGGWGKIRGQSLTNFFMTYGYEWQEVNPRIQTWCTNTVDGSLIAGGTYESEVLYGFFEEAGKRTTQYEGIPAEFDSGGGWFIFENGQWKLVGLTNSVGHYNNEPLTSEAWFMSPTNPLSPYPDYMVSVRVSTYADWINSIMAQDCEGLMGDLNGGCGVDLQDLAQLTQNWLQTGCKPENNYCGGADINRDKSVNLSDVCHMCSNWLKEGSNQPPPTSPGPSSPEFDYTAMPTTR